jgi:hypothetical protein
MDDHTYKFRVITRSETKTTMGMGVVVTVSVLVGENDHLSLSGTLSMTEPEWLPLAAALKEGLRGRVEFEEITRH